MTDVSIVADAARRRPPAPRPVPAPGRDAAARSRRRRRRRGRRPRRARRQPAPQGHHRGPARAALAGRRARRSRPAPTMLDECLVAAADQLRVAHPAGRRRPQRRRPVRGAHRPRPRRVGVLALAFPLHPPGRPERSRLDELQAVQVPTLVVQGERDPFGRPEEFPPDRELAVVPGGRPRLQGAQARTGDRRGRRWRSSSRRCSSAWSATSSASGNRSGVTRWPGDRPTAARASDGCPADRDVRNA